MKLLQEKKKSIHEALCDNFNTPLVLKNLQELISKTYEYESKTRANTFKLHTAFSIAQFVANILKALGLVYRNEFLEYFILDSNQQTSEEVVTPYIETSVKFRDNIKAAASTDKDLIKVLKLCDELRDDIYPYMGIKIEDKGKGAPSVWKFYDKEIYVKELQRQKEQAEMARIKKEELNKENELKVYLSIVLINIAQLSTCAKDYYALQADKFSKFDEEGVPTHDAKEVEISKELKNKLKKEFKKHEEKHQKWLEQKKSKEEKK